MFADLLSHGAQLTAMAPLSVPDPGSGSAPPGSGGFLQILGWVKWVSLGVCVAGLLIGGAVMAINSRRGEGGEHVGRIVMVLGGVVVIAAAFSAVSALAEGTA